MKLTCVTRRRVRKSPPAGEDALDGDNEVERQERVHVVMGLTSPSWGQRCSHGNVGGSAAGGIHVGARPSAMSAGPEGPCG